MKRVATTSAYVRSWLPSVWKRALHRVLSFLLSLSMFPRRLLMLDAGASSTAKDNKRRWLRMIEDDSTEDASQAASDDLDEDGVEFFQAVESQSTTSHRRGLKNTGNTCFINAVVQCLLAIPGFVECLDEEVERIMEQDEGKKGDSAVSREAEKLEQNRQMQVQLALTLLDLLKGLLPEVAEDQEASCELDQNGDVQANGVTAVSAVEQNANGHHHTSEPEVTVSEQPTKSSHVSKKRKRPMTTSPGDYSAAATTKRLRRFLKAASTCSDLVAAEVRRQDQQDAEELLLFLLDSLHELLRRTPELPPNSNEDSAAKSAQLLELSRLVELEEECSQSLKKCVVTEPDTYNRTVCFLSDVRWHRYLKRNTSFITQMFTGQTVRGSQCCSCANLTCLHQEFRVLSLSIDASKSSQTIEECLENHRRMEDLVADNRVFCDGHCKDKTSRRTQVLFQRAPQTLVVQLQRFKQTSWQTSAEKIATNLQFPISAPLDLTASMFMRDAMLPVRYELQAICSHVGSALDSGHYIAYSRESPGESSDWVKFDDDYVTTLDEASLRHETQSTAYMLFYTQLDPSVAVTPREAMQKQTPIEIGDTVAIDNGNT